MPETQDWGAQPIGQVLFSSAVTLHVTEAAQTTAIVAGSAGKKTVLYLATLLPPNAAPNAGEGLRDWVAVRLEGDIGLTAVAFGGLSPQTPFAFLNIPQGITGQLAAEGIQAVYCGAPGSGRQQVSLFVQYYRST